MKIIYVQPTGVVAVIHPIQEVVDQYGIDAIAQKDVPPGVPYKIVQDSDIPSDRAMRDAWTIDPALLTDGVGSESNEFSGVPA